jgi:hypothetical protein
MVVVGCVDFFPNSIDRITRRLAELVKLLPPVYDDARAQLDTMSERNLAVQSAATSTNRSGSWHLFFPSKTGVAQQVINPLIRS